VGDQNNPYNPPAPLSTVTTLPPPTTPPPFLDGLTKLWFDDASSQTPVEQGKYSGYAMQRKDGAQVTSTCFCDIVPSRFVRHPTGGPHGMPYYTFYAPQGDNIWTPGTRGRSELSIAETPQNTNFCQHHDTSPDNAVYFCPGHRYVTLFSIRLPTSWNLNPGSWRGLWQWKHNWWVSPIDQPYPSLGFDQWNGEWRVPDYDMTGNGTSTVWTKPATTADLGHWINWAVDITFSADPTVGKVTIYGDFNDDGIYEYSAGPFYRQTLDTSNGVPIEAMAEQGIYEGIGGDTVDKADMSIWGSP
jgi:hypothetical protein